MEFDFVEKLQGQQAQIVMKFMESLSNGDVNSFWDCLSKGDKAYIVGTLEGINTTVEEPYHFNDWLQECFEITSRYFERYIDNYGVSTSVRYNNKLVANVYLPLGIKTNITFIQETDAQVMILPLILETNLDDNGEIIAEWKVFLFTNDDIEAPF